MVDILKGKCNKCDREYDTAPVGTVHKCGICPGGIVVVEGRDILLDSIAQSFSSGEPPIYPKLCGVTINSEEQNTWVFDDHGIRKKIEDEICDHLRQTLLRKDFIDAIVNIIENRKYIRK